MAEHRHLKIDPRRIAKVRRNDFIAKVVISTGGVAVILTVVAIMAQIISVTLPLFKSPTSSLKLSQSLPASTVAKEPLGANVEEYLENAFVLTRQGDVDLFKITDEGFQLTESVVLRTDDRIVQATQTGRNRWSLLWESGYASLVQMLVTPNFSQDGVRTINPSVETVAEVPLQGDAMPAQSFVRKADAGVIRVDIHLPNRLVYSYLPGEDEGGGVDPLFGGRETSSPTITERSLNMSGSITAAEVSYSGEQVYLGSDTGDLAWLRFDDEGDPVAEKISRSHTSTGITALGFVFGDVSIVVADQVGQLSVYFPEAVDDGYEFIHFADLEPQQAAVTAIENSARNKMILTRNEKSEIHFDYLTSRKRIFSFDHSDKLASIGYSPRGDGLISLGQERNSLMLWKLNAPHPETSWSTLFGEIWYENYPEPEYVWQSTGGSDDFESKMSLVPLIFGTLKATLYAMMVALPLGIFGAIYLSYFASPIFRDWIKPIVELMAALPSVVIGFLVALWLAPLFESAIVGVFATVILIPLFFALFMLFWQLIRHKNFAKRIERGYEFIVLLPVTALAMATAFYLTPFLELWLFQGDFAQWLYTTTDTRFDQRNSIIIAVGLGVAVIPIVFSISEDSLSSVPKELSSSSLALGASRWQTVWRVVVPSASPGIFAAAMIGFGRAVGETMIVLMATGNTPIMDWSIFNGMRTLSANIAVEIPEAPIDGTLYRTLFLCAVILFIMTFFLNTVAEVVRHSLRKKYGRF